MRKIRKIKQLTALLLMTVIFVQGFNLTVYADPIEEEVMEEEEIIEEYTYISSIRASLVINGGILSGTASATISGNHDSRLTVTVLRSTSVNGSYTTYTGWSEAFSGSGGKTTTRSFSVPKGYTYRLKVVLRVYNSSGSTIESATKYSSKVTYN